VGDPSIKRPTYKRQQNIIQYKTVAIKTNCLLSLLLLLLNTLKMELRQTGFRLRAGSGDEPSGYSVKVRQLSLLLSSNDCCYILIIVQRDATQSSLFIILQIHSTCFGC